MEVGEDQMRSWLRRVQIEHEDRIVVENLRGRASALTLSSAKGRLRVARWLADQNAEGVVVVFADADMMYDAFTVQQDPMTGGMVAVDGNLPMFLNAVEILSGGRREARVVLVQPARTPKTMSFPKLYIMIPAGIFSLLGLVGGARRVDLRARLAHALHAGA